MTRRIEPKVRNDAFDLLPQQGDLARVAVIHGGGEQTKNALLAGDAALFVEGLDADVIEVGRAMHGRDRIRLRDREQLRIARVLAHRARERSQLELRATATTQNAESSVGDRLDDVFAASALQCVFAITQEREVV